MSQTLDRIENIGGALIQHGPLSERVYLMKLGEAQPLSLLPKLDALVLERGYSKAFAKVPESVASCFVGFGYRPEALIPGFYQGQEDGLFMCKFFQRERRVEREGAAYAEVLCLVQERGQVQEASTETPIRLCNKEEVQAMAALYSCVFPSYPFPIYDPNYLRATMEDNVVYAGVEQGGELVALASGEMDGKSQNVEMTDFATHPDHRGQGYAASLLAFLEADMKNRDIHTAYTIARALSPGMNLTFSRAGYHFAGRLINNTQIAGKIESMNVWYKHRDNA